MISFLVDQNFNEHVVDGLDQREASLNFTHVRNVGLATAQIRRFWSGLRRRPGTPTHDGRTIPAFAYARVAAGQPMPGVFLVDDRMPIGHAIDEIFLAAHCLTPDECKDIVMFFPM